MEAFCTEERVKSINEFVSDFKELDIKGILIAWDSETLSGVPGISNDYIAELSRAYPEVLPVGWAMVYPWKGDWAIEEAERAITALYGWAHDSTTIVHVTARTNRI